MSDERALAGVGVPAGALDAPGNAYRPPARPSTPQLLLAALAAGPLSGRAVARRLGVRWSDVVIAVSALSAAGVVIREGRGRSARLRVAR